MKVKLKAPGEWSGKVTAIIGALGYEVEDLGHTSDVIAFEVSSDHGATAIAAVLTALGYETCRHVADDADQARQWALAEISRRYSLTDLEDHVLRYGAKESGNLGPVAQRTVEYYAACIESKAGVNVDDIDTLIATIATTDPIEGAA